MDEKSNMDISAQKTKIKNELTAHVTTRAYRAPEIMMIEAYHYAADVWSCAVVLGELFLKVESQNLAKASKTHLLFYGNHCFPLSPS